MRANDSVCICLLLPSGRVSHRTNCCNFRCMRSQPVAALLCMRSQPVEALLDDYGCYVLVHCKLTSGLREINSLSIKDGTHAASTAPRWVWQHRCRGVCHHARCHRRYEKRYIERWLEQGHLSCPVTGQPLTRPVALTPNVALRHSIEDWAQQHAIFLLVRLALAPRSDGSADTACLRTCIAFDDFLRVSSPITVRGMRTCAKSLCTVRSRCWAARQARL